MYDVVGIDMPCMDLNVNLSKFPMPDYGERINQLNWQGGGKVASGMVACARLDAKCAMMGCVGDDIFGKFIVNDFKLHGIDTSALKIQQGDTSSLSVVLSESAAGSRTILHKGGTTPRYTNENMDADLIRSAKYLFICQADSVVNYAVDIAREAGVKIFIDADGYSEAIMNMLPKIDIFVGSNYFYNELFGDENYEENCRKIMGMGLQVALFTLGSKGCVGVSEEGFFKLPAFAVNVVDTVGAGDVFHGAFLAGLLKNYSVEEAARFASAVAAIKCTRIGGRAGIPDTKTVLRFLQDGFIDYTDIDARVKYYERGLEHAYEK